VIHKNRWELILIESKITENTGQIQVENYDGIAILAKFASENPIGYSFIVFGCSKVLLREHSGSRE